ncbi:unnamed protein product [Larinioides sclopetarius]|uniref:Uncharacterized protein n=1 Tax=Larinioides sclopetarius TaxID=280406 RepID=A0AAV2BWW3_9ARAC
MCAERQCDMIYKYGVGIRFSFEINCNKKIMAVKNFLWNLIGQLCMGPNYSSTVFFLNFALLYRVSEYLLLYKYQQQNIWWFQIIIWYLIVLYILTKVLSKSKIFRSCISLKCCVAAMKYVKKGMRKPYIEEGLQLFSMCLVFYSFKEKDSTVINSIAEFIMVLQMAIIVFRQNFIVNKIHFMVILTSIMFCCIHGNNIMFIQNLNLKLLDTCWFILGFVTVNIVLIFIATSCSILSKILGYLSRMLVSYICLMICIN